VNKFTYSKYTLNLDYVKLLPANNSSQYLAHGWTLIMSVIDASISIKFTYYNTLLYTVVWYTVYELTDKHCAQFHS